MTTVFDQTLLLFDVDGVLLHPMGYKEALRASVDYFARELGLEPFDITHHEIAIFEASGMTNEWLSGAMCLGAMLAEATAHQPDLIKQTLTGCMAAIRAKHLDCPRPNFAMLAQMVHARSNGSVPTAKVILDVLCNRTVPALHPALVDILRTIRPPEAPFARIFQHFTLGHQKFTEIYGIPPSLESVGYLATLDRPQISPEWAQRLTWLLKADHCRAAIYTARPSLPLQDWVWHDGNGLADRHLYPPEADMAADLLGLSGILPLIGEGRMAWLAERHGKSPDAYIKPSPVQALAAIASARAMDERIGLEAVGELIEEQRVVGPIGRIIQEHTRIIVLEDSAGGIQAAQQAVALLRAQGAEIILVTVGIAHEPAKQQVLAGIADRLAPDVNAALTMVLGDYLTATIPHTGPDFGNDK